MTTEKTSKLRSVRFRGDLLSEIEAAAGRARVTVNRLVERACIAYLQNPPKRNAAILLLPSEVSIDSGKVVPKIWFDADPLKLKVVEDGKELRLRFVEGRAHYELSLSAEKYGKKRFSGSILYKKMPVGAAQCTRTEGVGLVQAVGQFKEGKRNYRWIAVWPSKPSPESAIETAASERSERERPVSISGPPRPLAPSILASSHASAQTVHIFWDASNMFIPAQDVAQQKEGWDAKNDIRLHFQNLFDLARAGRPLGSAFAAGSERDAGQLRDVWKSLARTGLTLEVFVRGAGTNREQAVDQALQVQMLRVLADQPPQVAVLMTGDGRGYDSGVGFHADLERMRKRGWGIEVISWDVACAAKLRSWGREAGIYIRLEDYYDQVTYRTRLRRASPLSLKHRGRARPGGNQDLQLSSR